MDDLYLTMSTSLVAGWTIYIYIYISKNKNNILIMVDAHTKKGQTDSISCFPSWLLWLALFSLHKSNQFNH